MWALRGLDEREARGELGALMDVDEPAVALRRARRRKQTRAFDLWSTGVTPSGQVMEHFRELLDAQNVVPAAQLREACRAISACRVGGLVITRQRPGTAKGFVFLTLEDETGLVNVIVRPDVYETLSPHDPLLVDAHRRGRLQKESGCIDLLAQRVWAFDGEGVTDGVRAHNFH